MSGHIGYDFPDSRPSHTFSYLLTPLLALLNRDKNHCILDLGCGNGNFVDRLNTEGYNAFGVDSSKEGITVANARNPGRFFLQDVSTGKLPGELQNIKFDTIISTEVIEHLYDPERFINFCKEVLDDKGQLIISTPYHGYLKNLVLSLFNGWDKHHGAAWFGGHIKFWSKNTLSTLLRNAGFKVTDFKGCGRMPYFWKSMMIKAELN